MSSKTVLLVEDNEELLGVLSRAFEKAGYVVHTALDGRRALRVFGAEPPQLVVTDIMMADSDGIELISNVRKLDPAVKIVVISGVPVYHGLNLLDLARGLGADAAMVKPFKTSDLLRLAESLLPSAQPVGEDVA